MTMTAQAPTPTPAGAPLAPDEILAYARNHARLIHAALDRMCQHGEFWAHDGLLTDDGREIVAAVHDVATRASEVVRESAGHGDGFGGLDFNSAEALAVVAAATRDPDSHPRSRYVLEGLLTGIVDFLAKIGSAPEEVV